MDTLLTTPLLQHLDGLFLVATDYTITHYPVYQTVLKRPIPFVLEYVPYPSHSYHSLTGQTIGSLTDPRAPTAWHLARLDGQRQASPTMGHLDAPFYRMLIGISRLSPVKSTPVVRPLKKQGPK